MKIKITPPSPLAIEYSAQKKQNAQSNKSATSRLNAIHEDVVTLSSGQPDILNTPVKAEPSKPVTLEEQRLLYSGFSVQV